MAVNKVTYGGSTLIDLTGDTVTSASLLSGYTAHRADGVSIIGTASGGSSVEVINEITGQETTIDSYIMSGQTAPIKSITISDVDLIEGVSELAEGEIYVYME